MIKLITGKKGSGKTKILIDQINNAVKDTNGCRLCQKSRSSFSIFRKCGTVALNV